ncbi:MAG: DUF1295 domain-containing protein [Leptolyngbya sp. SIOISBB]|nr:DUF1295 domain-containing protein [Leptolyngbya sp. SIOISBB]
MDEAIAIALLLYLFGSLINISADVQKMTAKSMGAGLVKDGAWRHVRNINYLGDLMRYTSFAVVAGSPWAYILPATIAALYAQRILQKEQSMGNKYPDFEAYQANWTVRSSFCESGMPLEKEHSRQECSRLAEITTISQIHYGVMPALGANPAAVAPRLRT